MQQSKHNVWITYTHNYKFSRTFSKVAERKIWIIGCSWNIQEEQNKRKGALFLTNAKQRKLDNLKCKNEFRKWGLRNLPRSCIKQFALKVLKSSIHFNSSWDIPSLSKCMSNETCDRMNTPPPPSPQKICQIWAIL
jgi:hypothetical protein